MTGAELLEELRSRGARLTVRGDKILVKAPAEILTEAMRARLADCKAELMAILRHQPEGTQPLRAVEFRLRDYKPNEWATVLAANAGAAFKDLSERYPGRLERAMTKP